MNENLVLAVANAYQQKYFLNPIYSKLPEEIKKKIQILAVQFVEEVGGILELSFDEEGSLQLKVHVAEHDFSFDEIGAELLIKRLQAEEEELFTQLEMYFMGMNL